MKRSRFLIITSQFNEDITSRLTLGAKEALFSQGVREDDVRQVSVPGAFELPAVAAKAASTGQWDAILCLGCLIKGDTDHYHYICDAVANGITAVGVQYKLPVLFGVLTVHNREQALARASLDENKNASHREDGKRILHNVGHSTALAAILTLKTLGELDGPAV